MYTGSFVRLEMPSSSGIVHNIKNDRYQFIGGSCLPTIGNLVVDADLLRQAEVSAELIRVKDFASDKKVETLVSYKMLKVLSSALSSGKAVGLIEDAGALACTLMFMRLHLHAVNGKDVPANHRALFLWCSMIWITSVSGVHITSKRNIVSETISNAFLSMRADVTKFCMLTSEPAEHGFGNTRKQSTARIHMCRCSFCIPF